MQLGSRCYIYEISMRKRHSYCGMSAESQNCETRREPLAWNGSTNTPVVRQQHRKHAKIPEPSLSNVPVQKWRDYWKRCFLRGPCLGYNEDQLSLQKSRKTAVRIVGGWCEMDASLRGREPGSTGTSTVGSRYQAAQ
jgi:hypothetical protein